MDEHMIAKKNGSVEQEDAVGGGKASIAESNFDELTPEQQECVRERFAHFFRLVFNL